MNTRVLAIILSAVVLMACTKEDAPKTTGDITLQGLTCTANPVKAWDTTLITMTATGSDLQYAWEANHGDINGSGPTVKYAAGQCCIGLNTVKCTVFNNTGEASDTIMIRVTSYYGP